MDNVDRFSRWQGRTLEEFSKLINHLLSLSFATIGYVITMLSSVTKSELIESYKKCFLFGIFFLLITVVLLLIVSYNRVLSFRKTTAIVKEQKDGNINGLEQKRNQVRKIDRRTWLLFSISTFTFLIGEIVLISLFGVVVFLKN